MASSDSITSVEKCSDTTISIREVGKLNHINNLNSHEEMPNVMEIERESTKNSSDSTEGSNKRTIESQEKKIGKRPRTNYKDPENSAKLNAALSMLINQDGEGQIIKDIKSVAKLFGVPYNTLRDNFLR